MLSSRGRDLILLLILDFVLISKPAGHTVLNWYGKKYYLTQEKILYNNITQRCIDLGVQELRFSNNDEFLDWANAMDGAVGFEDKMFWVLAGKGLGRSSTWWWRKRVIFDSLILDPVESVVNKCSGGEICLGSKADKDHRLLQICCSELHYFVCDQTDYCAPKPCPNHLFTCYLRGGSFDCELETSPTLEIHPEVSPIGGDVQLSCDVFSSNDNISRDEIQSYRWFKNGSLLTGPNRRIVTDAVINLTSVTFTDNGDYTCQFISHSKESLPSSPRRLQVIAPEVPVLHVNATVVDLGGNVALSCNVSRSYSGTVYSFLTPGGREILHKENKLEISDFNVHDAGDYYCKVTVLDTPSAQSVGVKVKLKLGRPYLSAGQTNLLLGGSTLLTCDIQNNTTTDNDLTYIWKLDGNVKQAETNVSKWNVTEFDRSREGSYTCNVMVSGVESETSPPMKLSYEWPSTEISASVTDVTPGSVVVLTCSSTDPGPKLFSFYHNETLLPNDDSATSRGHRVESSELRVQNFKERDTGVYHCELVSLIDGVMGPRSNSITLTLLPPPVITSAASMVPEGSTIKITCNSHYDNILSYSWAKDGKILYTSSTNITEIKSFALVDQGNYSCKTNLNHTLSSHYVWSNQVRLTFVEKFHRCSCKCSANAVKVNMTQEEKATKVKEIQEVLEVKNTNLTLVRRKKISAPDERPSSVTGGALAIILMASVCISIVLSDVLPRIRCGKRRCKNISIKRELETEL